jgi:hypothetical protein
MPNTRSTEPRRGAGRPWGVALLVWLAVSCMMAVAVLAGFQMAGKAYFESVNGSAQVGDFMRRAFLYPGVLLPALIVWRPRWSAAACAVLFVVVLVLTVRRGLEGPATHALLIFWVGSVLPVVVLGLATALAYRRRDWLPAALSREASRDRRR